MPSDGFEPGLKSHDYVNITHCTAYILKQLYTVLKRHFEQRRFTSVKLYYERNALIQTSCANVPGTSTKVSEAALDNSSNLCSTTAKGMLQREHTQKEIVYFQSMVLSVVTLFT